MDTLLAERMVESVQNLRRTSSTSSITTPFVIAETTAGVRQTWLRCQSCLLPTVSKTNTTSCWLIQAHTHIYHVELWRVYSVS